MIHITGERQATAATRAQGRQWWKTTTSIKSCEASSRRCYREFLNAAIAYFSHFSSHATLQEEAYWLRADSGCTRPPGRPNDGIPTERGKRGLRLEASLPPLDHSPDVLSLSAALRRQRVNCQRQHNLGDNAHPEAAARKQIYVNKHTALHRPSQGQITTCTRARLVTNRAHFNCCSVNLLQWTLVTLPALPIAKGHNYSPGAAGETYTTLPDRKLRIQVWSSVLSFPKHFKAKRTAGLSICHFEICAAHIFS